MAVPEEEMLQWLTINESAKTMLKRVLERQKPSLAPLPPLHRVNLHGGHVLEMAGQSGSGKSEIMLQAVVSCILPKEWQGLKLGGSEKPAVFIDLDCHFDMPRLVKLLHHRVREAQAYKDLSEKAAPAWSLAMGVDSVDELLSTSLKRFYLKRCFNSFEFLVALKTIRPLLKQLEMEHGSSAQLLLIDSIGAFYWLDRAVRSVPTDAGRKALSLHTVSEAVVRELGQLVRTYPSLLIMATKTIIHHEPGKEYSAQMGSSNQNIDRNQAEGNFSGTGSAVNFHRKQGNFHREYMPAAWQGFVTHRLLLQGPYRSGSNDVYFTAKWDIPPSNFVDRFVIQNEGIKLANSRSM
ncbi:DNA-repair protein XRCC2 [Marchantia polymorpha subsp. ruderalis]|uniref:RecA family profile 1 domain-containing protein n=2 Tax=Marchantia polymorpha TaxID=3197 RepID=A0AAF6B9Y8_MARPO|nr:hypothetical protein MARPO_0070s0006 [Marchantia polymorpha]BBN08822.1 hypothetical protein Mp_4g14750 [Marchantia polymorpha subsp. ruderalis]|eukprot:PTQ35530.1 hypothetical protein MARPO_0070s0006 [Marchantia polymorpha]